MRAELYRGAKLVETQAFCYIEREKNPQKTKKKATEVRMDQLDQFIKEIIDTKQLPGITEEAKAGLLEEMRERLLDMLNRALVEALPEDKLAGFSALLDEDASDEQVQNYIVENGVDVQKVTAQTMLAFRTLYLQPAGERTEE